MKIVKVTMLKPHGNKKAGRVYKVDEGKAKTYEKLGLAKVGVHKLDTDVSDFSKEEDSSPSRTYGFRRKKKSSEEGDK